MYAELDRLMDELPALWSRGGGGEVRNLLQGDAAA
jgi:hypothetical protein